MGLTYDSVAKAEKALVKLGFLSRGEDTKGQYWKAKDPDPMNLWTVQRSEYIPSSDGNHAEVSMGAPSEASMETVRGQHGNHPTSDGNRPRSARDVAEDAVSMGNAGWSKEPVEEKIEEKTQESAEDAPRPREDDTTSGESVSRFQQPPPRPATETCPTCGSVVSLLYSLPYGVSGPHICRECLSRYERTGSVTA
jgi:hypothetical protein